jgi:hypothetical protein
MLKSWFRRNIPHFIAIGVFLVVALVYCSPVLQGKNLSPGDTSGWKAMAQNSYEYKKVHGHFPLWTENIFSGMPAYQVAMDAPTVSPQYFALWGLTGFTIFLTDGSLNPAALFLLACLCFYILTQALRINPYIGIATGLAFAYSTYNPAILVVGHFTKMNAIAVMPAIFASLIWLFEKKYLLGTATLALFTALDVAANHPQIVYYGLIAAGIMTVAYAIRWIKAKEFAHIGKVVVLGAIGAGIGIACNAIVTMTTADYAKASLRSGSELAAEGGSVTKTGLSEDYALNYSSYKTESFTLLAPKMYGGSDVDPAIVADNSHTMEALQSMPQQIAQQLYPRSYWGGISTTAGPAYAGAIICLFALVGFFLLDNKHKWWILAASLFALALSWGGYFREFNVFLLKTLPGMNKFRAPSVAVVVPVMLLCLLAALTLDKLFRLTAAERNEVWKKYKKGLFLVGGVFLVLFIMYGSFDYTGEGERGLQQQVSQMPAQVQEYVRSYLHALKEDRQGMFMSSILRSLVYIALAAAVGFLWIKGRIKPLLAVGIIGALSFIDLITLDVQYLTAEKYVDNEEAQSAFQLDPLEADVKKDTSYYRVLDLRAGVQNITNSSTLPYFFHDIAGYHPAKLGIFQDVIENQLYKFPNCQPTLDMMNAKYVLKPRDANKDSALNPGACGPVWFVKGIRYVDSPRAAMNALTTLNVRDTAVIIGASQNISSQPAEGDSIWLTKNDNDEMDYQSKTSGTRFAVFSEVYYNRGWRAMIDNAEAPIVRTNFALRGLVIPAGSHSIKFEFHPSSYYTGRTIQIVASIILWLFLAFAGYQLVRKRP